jgi:tetratricopeptide (TPR) repeat protein
LGWLYQKQGRISEAEELFKKAIADNLKSYQAFIGLGMFYRQQGRFAEAEELFKKAIALNPEDDWNKERGYRALASLYREMHKTKLAQEYSRKVFNGYALLTINNYRKLKRILDKKGIRLVCAQYPMRSIAPLKDIFAGNPDVILVDNEQLFKEAVMRDGYMEYFRDMASGDFGHCTRKGNRLLAENIANLILKEVFGK